MENWYKLHGVGVLLAGPEPHLVGGTVADFMVRAVVRNLVRNMIGGRLPPEASNVAVKFRLRWMDCIDAKGRQESRPNGLRAAYGNDLAGTPADRVSAPVAPADAHMM